MNTPETPSSSRWLAGKTWHMWRSHDTACAVWAGTLTRCAALSSGGAAQSEAPHLRGRGGGRVWPCEGLVDSLLLLEIHTHTLKRCPHHLRTLAVLTLYIQASAWQEGRHIACRFPAHDWPPICLQIQRCVSETAQNSLQRLSLVTRASTLESHSRFPTRPQSKLWEKSGLRQQPVRLKVIQIKGMNQRHKQV